MIATILLASVLALPQPPAGPSRLAVIQKAPGFELTDQGGNKVRLADLDEDVLLVSFIFTTCNGSCPATTHRMAKVQDELRARGVLEAGRVRFVSITLDPERDTPEALKRYMQLYEIDPGTWSFLTGDAEKVRGVIGAWGMWVRPAAGGQLDHPSRIFLVDKNRDVREIYNLGFLQTDWVVADVEELLAEAAKSRR